MFGFGKKKLSRIDKHDYAMVHEASMKALKNLVSIDDVYPGSLNEKMRVISIDGATVVWIEPWFFLGALCEQMGVCEANQEKMVKHIQKVKAKFFGHQMESEKSLKKRDVLEHTYILYELILKGIFEHLNNNVILDPQDIPLIHQIVHDMSETLIRFSEDQDEKKAA